MAATHGPPQMTAPQGVQRRAFSAAAPSDTGACVRGDAICMGDEPVAALSDNPLPGRHNLANVLAALTMMRAGGFDWDKTLDGLRAFRGVEHRIEAVATIDGADFYNDSKSDQPRQPPRGSREFRAPYRADCRRPRQGQRLRTPVGIGAPARKKRLVTLGEDAPLLEAAFAGLVETERAGGMTDAVQRGARSRGAGRRRFTLARLWRAFDTYKNFEERGRDFKACVRRLAERKGQSS